MQEHYYMVLKKEYCSVDSLLAIIGPRNWCCWNATNYKAGGTTSTAPAEVKEVETTAATEPLLKKL
jgi:hypothetical protein